MTFSRSTVINILILLGSVFGAMTMLTGEVRATGVDALATCDSQLDGGLECAHQSSICDYFPFFLMCYVWSFVTHVYPFWFPFVFPFLFPFLTPFIYPCTYKIITVVLYFYLWARGYVRTDGR